jgi:hypothetical protein
MIEVRHGDASARRETHSHPVEGGRGFWWTDQLWPLVDGLIPFRIAIGEIREFEMNCWFGEQTPPTCRAVAEHARRIWDADLSHPVILAADGGLMDGGHRLAKAWLQGDTHIDAVQFRTDPPPDWVQ